MLILSASPCKINNYKLCKTDYVIEVSIKLINNTKNVDKNKKNFNESIEIYKKTDRNLRQKIMFCLFLKIFIPKTS